MIAVFVFFLFIIYSTKTRSVWQQPISVVIAKLIVLDQIKPLLLLILSISTRSPPKLIM